MVQRGLSTNENQGRRGGKIDAFHFIVRPHCGGELRRGFVFNPGVSNELNSALKCAYISLPLELIFFCH